MAERGGFEPPVVFSYSRFPGVRLKPLSHLSAAGETVRNVGPSGQPKLLVFRDGSVPPRSRPWRGARFERVCREASMGIDPFPFWGLSQ